MVAARHRQLAASLAACACLLASSRAGAEVYADSRDPWTLLPPKILNRQLFEQLAAPAQSFRKGGGMEYFAFAADAAVGGQVRVGASELTRFHGYFLFDTYLSFRPFAGLDANLNVALLNPSASDGYRVSSEVLPGLSLHFHRELLRLFDAPLRIDLVAFDLDWVTLGRGLLVENLPLEGYSGAVSWNGVRLQAVFGGRVIWDNDDLWSLSLGTDLGDTASIELQYALWSWEANPIAAELGPSVAGADLLAVVPTYSHYVGLSGTWEALENLGFAAEVLLRLRQHPKLALLLRADYRSFRLWHAQVHFGYQLRFYQQGVGSAAALTEPTAVYNTPQRQHTYVTNSFEFFGVAKFYDQWSNTLMLEVRVPIWAGFEITADVEYWIRVITDPRAHDRVVFLPRGGRAPGILNDIFYRFGLAIRPWRDLPHRLSGVITNKLVAAGGSAIDFETRRFTTEPLLMFEVEAYL